MPPGARWPVPGPPGVSRATTASSGARAARRSSSPTPSKARPAFSPAPRAARTAPGAGGRQPCRQAAARSAYRRGLANCASRGESWTRAGRDLHGWQERRRSSFAPRVIRVVGTQASRARRRGAPQAKTTPARPRTTAGSRAASSATTATRLAATSAPAWRATARTAAPAGKRAAAARPVAPACA